MSLKERKRKRNMMMESSFDDMKHRLLQSFNTMSRPKREELIYALQKENTKINSSTSPSATLEKPKETNSSFIQDCYEVKVNSYVHTCLKCGHKSNITSIRSPK